MVLVEHVLAQKFYIATGLLPLEHHTLLTLLLSRVYSTTDSVGGDREPDLGLLVHLHSNHKLLDSHHLVDTMVSRVLSWVAGGEALRHPVNISFPHVFGQEAIIWVAVWTLCILDRLAVLIVQSIL